jgi:hypothetical protein
MGLPDCALSKTQREKERERLERAPWGEFGIAISSAGAYSLRTPCAHVEHVRGGGGL